YRSDNFLPYLYVSDDYGVSWKKLGKDLPAEPINVIREDPKSDSILYAGTDGGLYVSFDQGNSFMMWNGGLPKSIPVHDIAIQERENEIILGTHGRSLYICELDDIQMQQKDPDWIKNKMEKEKHTPAPNANVDDLKSSMEPERD
ncbi:MAG: glycosyl hydrolase, partial [Bacteroidia bacterium]|nr:glycosyl hydrolase [Bacteroidia bacterium]